MGGRDALDAGGGILVPEPAAPSRPPPSAIDAEVVAIGEQGRLVA